MNFQIVGAVVVSIIILGLIWYFMGSNYKDTLEENEFLKIEGSPREGGFTKLTSKNGYFTLIINDNGVLEIVERGRVFGTSNKNVDLASVIYKLQGDTNLVGRDNINGVLWASGRGELGTGGKVKLVLEDDGVVKLYNKSGNHIWNSK